MEISRPTIVAPPAPSAPAAPIVSPSESAFSLRLAEAIAATSTDLVTPELPLTDEAAAAVRASASHAVTLGAMLRAGTTAGATAGPTSLGDMVGALTGLAASAGAAAPAANMDGAARGSGVFSGHAATVAPVEGRRTSSFGPRTHPISGGVRDHHGLDIAAPSGTPVRSVTDGTVIAAGDRGGYGLVVEVDHGDGITSRYAHLSAIDVTVGQRLGVGATLGAVGSTGNSTGPHLHVEVRDDGEPIDPDGLW